MVSWDITESICCLPAVVPHWSWPLQLHCTALLAQFSAHSTLAHFVKKVLKMIESMSCLYAYSYILHSCIDSVDYFKS